jgi:hypothetical protein
VGHRTGAEPKGAVVEAPVADTPPSELALGELVAPEPDQAALGDVATLPRHPHESGQTSSEAASSSGRMP